MHLEGLVQRARTEVATQLGTLELYCVLRCTEVYSNYAGCVHVVFCKMVEDAKYDERPLADKTSIYLEA